MAKKSSSSTKKNAIKKTVKSAGKKLNKTGAKVIASRLSVSAKKKTARKETKSKSKSNNEMVNKPLATAITLQRIMDDGFGTVHCIQKQTFELGEINEYFDKAAEISTNFRVKQEFKDIDSVINFLKEKEEREEYDFFMTLRNELDECENTEYFNSIANPDGYGNDVDRLVLIYKDKMLFER